MTDEAYTFLTGIVSQLLQVIIRIRFGEAEGIAVLRPVAVPAVVPTLNKHTAEAVLGGKVDIAHGVGGGCPVFGTLCPSILFHVHAPPDADVASRFYPGSVFQLTRLIEIQHQPREHEIAGCLAHDNRTPRCGKGSGGKYLLARAPRGEGGAKRHAFFLFVSSGCQVQTGVVRQIGFVQHHVEAVVHFQGDGGGNGIFPAERRSGEEGFVILGTIGGDRPCFGIPGESIFGFLIHNDELLQVLLFGENVAESQSVIEEPEYDAETALQSVSFLQVEGQLVVVVTYFHFLAPRLCPSFVEGAMAYLFQAEVIVQRSVFEDEAEGGGVDEGFRTLCQRVVGTAVLHSGCQAEPTVGRLQGFCCSATTRGQ